MMSGGGPPDKPGGAAPAAGAPAPSRLLLPAPPAGPPAAPAPGRPRTVAAKFEALLAPTRRDVDSPGAGEVESTSAPQKAGGPERKLEADPDENETGEGDRDRDASLSAGNSSVKPPPSTDGAGDVTEDNSGDARGRVLPFRRWQRATLSSVSTLFDTEGVDLRLDVALGALMVYARPPWASKDDAGPYPRPVRRVDELSAARWISEMHAEDVSVVVVADAMRLTAANPDRQVDSVRDAVLAAAGAWDGSPRIDSDLSTRLGLDDRTADKQRAAAQWFVASVRRMISPGAPLEDVLLVEEAQASLRATVHALASLVPRELVLDTSLNFDCRFSVAARRLVGRGLVVVSDASHHTVRELETLVAFATSPSDGEELPPRHAGFALVASGRRQEHIPARCVVTSARRPPMETDAETLRQWLAEAVARVADYVPEIRSSTYRAKEHPWEVPVWNYLRKKPVQWVTTNTLLSECCKVPIHQREVRHHQALSDILKKLKWWETRVTPAGALVGEDEAPAVRGGRREKRIRVWVPPADFYVAAEPEGAPEGETAAETAAGAAPEPGSTGPAGS